MQSTKNDVRDQVDLQRVAATGEKIRRLVAQLGEIFPERQGLLQQIMYALLCKEHVLIFGTFGTGKSDLLHTLFEAFRGSTNFSIGLTKFMTEANVIGVPDPRKLRDDGEVHYRRDGGILDADFVELDEMLDSNAALLRVLLGILNERQFKRGRQVEDARLHTAVACTNGSPEDEIKRNPQLGAVIDRFMFQCRVNYLRDAGSRLQMYRKYLHGGRPTVSLTLAELKEISDVITDANQIDSDYLLEVYDKVIDGYVSQTKAVVSDRRRCKLLQLVEANALMYGRYEVCYEDLMAVRWGLCDAGNEQQLQAFESVARPIIEQAQAEQPQSVDEVQMRLLEELSLKLPPMPNGNLDSGQLVELRRLALRLEQEINEVRPTLQTTLDKKAGLLKRLAEVKDSAQQRIDAV